MSSINPNIAPLRPAFPKPTIRKDETEPFATTVKSLELLEHVEGGYFAEIDRNPLIIPNPFKPAATPAHPSGEITPPDEPSTNDSSSNATALQPRSGDDSTRNASTSIYYYLTPRTPQGHFHRNKGRTIHTLISGRGQYVLIHADEEGDKQGKRRVETYTVGHDAAKGEKSVWVVEGGKYKASYLLPDREGGDESGGLLISETVIPGFEYSDHDFLREEAFAELVSGEQAKELEWLVRREDKPQAEELL